MSYYDGGNAIFTPQRRIAGTGDIIDGQSIDSLDSVLESFNNSEQTAFEGTCSPGGTSIITPDGIILEGDNIAGKTITHITSNFVSINNNT